MKKADLFISLHINAHKQTNIHGLETYFLNMATDKRAVMVAARENATSEKNISDLQTILNDLMLNTKINESSRLAHKVQKGMIFRIKKRHKKVKSLGVKQAPFYVLIGAEMPAILVETGFITNSTERKRLLSQGMRLIKVVS
jgi:N-acetylmuramoyl-L-alanine amidase